MITKLLHDITQAGFEIRFTDDFKGMMTISYIGEGLDWKNHEHLNYPDGSIEELENKLEDSLKRFIKNIG